MLICSKNKNETDKLVELIVMFVNSKPTSLDSVLNDEEVSREF